jgi:hypothetical protein
MKNTCTQACPPSMMQRDDVGLLHAARVDALRRLHLRQRADPVAQAAARSNSIASDAACICAASVSCTWSSCPTEAFGVAHQRGVVRLET